MKTKKELNRIAAGFYLSKELPENWEDLDIDQQHQFINENAWEPFEGMPASEIEEEMTSLWHAFYKIEGDAYGEGYAEGYRASQEELCK